MVNHSSIVSLYQIIKEDKELLPKKVSPGIYEIETNALLGLEYIKSFTTSHTLIGSWYWAYFITVFTGVFLVYKNLHQSR